MSGSANLSYLFIPSSPLAYDPKHHAYQRSNSLSQGSAMPTTSSSSTSSSTDYTTYPLAKRNGRTILRDPDNPYPLPCDIPEIHRQSLRSLILMHVFGAPFCTPHFADHPPKRVLELACGSALWSNACHDYFARRGHKNMSFTGLDIVNLAPDLQKQGINWQFKRHDLRKSQLPFPDGYFDFVFIKDAGICPSGSELQTLPLGEPLRVLKSGGVLEVWDSDLIFRTLLPNPPLVPGLSGENVEHAVATGTYTIFPATPFADAQNKYLRDYNSWAQKAFERRRLTPMPCAMIGLSFTSESDSFNSMDSRRIAIPLGEVKWEREPQDGASKNWKQPKTLSADQLAIRQTALFTIVQMIESMEPMLMEVSGKGRDEWDRWWTGMTMDLLQNGGVASGECLEVGAWWGQKR
ncbi:SAM binding domain-containing protein containing protein [Histoplasma capsulatum G186AR]|uniref:SAM binding domain-containing protein containing protein n=2 Tax=Ajellomyces capsulatus TaxID=5037 RepID=C0NN17_AJECG|nr:SAM binding domain-containing protein containing protein [Histoplasma capsulatum G186AR]EEH07265.1 SAM binding domain-containing protein containing protein [Histoplasma capsulatum G186AR]KAG5304609.1 SAM binding domain-containing protein containing protein [Histoplasma capsulatum]QSS70207.1 SAM binding domain-containing protein containing protein [Histoplasma capsulatum G186AR]